ncbi:MAG TPA: hypothetical protein PK668_11705 [Myxococcota bacterium]|nr:hypothetical protein [Myxococcota bacterium]HRY93168.1 hypothetical protein [Myxococcota bacterium]
MPRLSNARGLIACAVLLGLGAGAAPALAWEWNDLRLRGRLQGRYEAFDRRVEEELGRAYVLEGWGHHLDLRRARLDARWTPFAWLRLELETELAGGDLELRDVFAELTPHEAARLTVGNFKKPFSRLGMDAAFELPVPERGLLHEYAVGGSAYGGFGGRDLGVMLSGKVALPAKLKLRYYLGVWNSAGELLDDGPPQHDYVARLQLKVWKGLVIGLGACHKVFELGELDGLQRTTNAFGGDIRFRRGDLWLQLEVSYGDRVDSGPGHRFLGGHLLGSYRVELGGDWALEPAAMLEVVDLDDQVEDDPRVRLSGQLNLHFTRHVRLGLYADGAFSQPRAYDPGQLAAVQLAWPLRVGLELRVGI